VSLEVDALGMLNFLRKLSHSVNLVALILLNLAKIVAFKEGTTELP